MIPTATVPQLSAFERYLSGWVALCIVAGVVLGAAAPTLVHTLSRLEVRHVNLPIAVLIWLMIYPMMLRIDFAALRGVGRRPTGILIVLFVNWLVKPFSMAALGWLFFKHLFAGLIGPDLGDQYLAGAIILAAAPCTAMVFVWSYLTDGDPAYTLVQVALNDLIMLVLFAPLVVLLLGISNITVPFDVLLASVLLYIVIPLTAGALSRSLLLRARGPAWFEGGSSWRG
jgi:ACR3 family arsenite transporter